MASLVAGAHAAAPAAGAQTLDFDRTFTVHDAGRDAHYAAMYRASGGEHRVEVWREGGTRIKRRTDDAIENYVVRPPSEVEWSMTVLDLKRKIRTDVARTNLLRIGHFTDWFAQGHALARPAGPYRLTAVAAPRGAEPLATCRWYALEQAGRSSRICWSTSRGLPLSIVDDGGSEVWRVTGFDRGPIDRRVFTIDDRGYARNDADSDIEAD